MKKIFSHFKSYFRISRFILETFLYRKWQLRDFRHFLKVDHNFAVFSIIDNSAKTLFYLFHFGDANCALVLYFCNCCFMMMNDVFVLHSNFCLYVETFSQLAKIFANFRNVLPFSKAKYLPIISN